MFIALVISIFKLKRAITALLLFYSLAICFFVLMFTTIYHKTGLIEVNGRFVTDWGSALYFSVVTWTTLGYGDLYPSMDSRIWSALEAALGDIHMGIWIGVILAFINNKSLFFKKFLLYTTIILTCFFVLIFAWIYTKTWLLQADGTFVNDWGSALYFSTITWTTLGYGDLYPSLGSSRILSALEAAIGYVCMGILIGVLLDIAIVKPPKKVDDSKTTH